MEIVRIFGEVLLMILDIVRWVVIVWVIISWLLLFASLTSFRWRYRGAYQALTQLNDICTRMAYPFVRPIRRMLRRFDTAGIDWSPLVLLIIIYILQRLIAAGFSSILKA